MRRSRRSPGPNLRERIRYGSDESIRIKRMRRIINAAAAAVHLEAQGGVNWNQLILGDDFYHVGLSDLLDGPVSDQPEEISAWLHDIGYAFLLEDHSTAEVYFYFNQADEMMSEMLNDVDSPLARFIIGVWKVKWQISQMMHSSSSSEGEVEFKNMERDRLLTHMEEKLNITESVMEDVVSEERVRINPPGHTYQEEVIDHYVSRYEIDAFGQPGRYLGEFPVYRTETKYQEDPPIWQISTVHNHRRVEHALGTIISGSGHGSVAGEARWGFHTSGGIDLTGSIRNMVRNYRKYDKNDRALLRIARSNIGRFMFPPKILKNERFFNWNMPTASRAYYFMMSINDVAEGADLTGNAGMLQHGSYSRYISLRRAIGTPVGGAQGTPADSTYDNESRIVWEKSITQHLVHNSNTFPMEVTLYEWSREGLTDTTVGIFTLIKNTVENENIYPDVVTDVRVNPVLTTDLTVENGLIEIMETDRNFSLRDIKDLLKAELHLEKHKSCTVRPGQFCKFTQFSRYGITTGIEFGSPAVRDAGNVRYVMFKVTTPMLASSTDKVGYPNPKIVYRVSTTDIMRNMPSGDLTHQVIHLSGPSAAGTLGQTPDLAETFAGTAGDRGHMAGEGGIRMMVDVAHSTVA